MINVRKKISIVCLGFLGFFPFMCEAQYPEIMWWHDLTAPSLGSAAVEDIDKDGKLEIVFGTYFTTGFNGYVYALNADSGGVLWSYNTGGCNDASPAIADVDQDGELEVILAASSPCKVFCFHGPTDSIEWVYDAPNCIDSPPAIADIDGDGKPEIVFGCFQGYVVALNGETGSERWQIDLGSSAIQTGPNILDLDGNDSLEVVVAEWTGNYWVYALRGHNGSTFWYSDAPSENMYHSGSFADIDEDGKPEIAIGCYDEYVYVLNGEDGDTLWSYKGPYYIGAPTSIADLNNDSHLEIVCCSWNRIIVLSHTGSQIWSRSMDAGSFRGAAIADIDGDSILDVVVGADDGKVYAKRGSDGAEIWTLDLWTHYGDTFEIDHAPTIADFDDDGKLDVFITGGRYSSSDPENNHGRAYCIRAGNGNPDAFGGNNTWLMFRHDLRHSACFDGPWQGIEENTLLKDVHLFQNYPNPFTRNTVIRYSLNEKRTINDSRLTIYDLSGRAVKTFNCLANQPINQIIWDRKDESGKNVPAGVYFYQLKIENFTNTKKLVVLE